MHAFHREVVQTCSAQRTPVTNTLRENAPRKRQFGAIAPDDFGHVQIMVRLHLPDAVGHKTGPLFGIPTCDAHARFVNRSALFLAARSCRCSLMMVSMSRLLMH